MESLGYEVRFRRHDWVECLIQGAGESWFGRGLDEESALAAAVAGACPSKLAARLLDEAVRHRRDLRAVAGRSNGERERLEVRGVDRALPESRLSESRPLASDSRVSEARGEVSPRPPEVRHVDLRGAPEPAVVSSSVGLGSPDLEPQETVATAPIPNGLARPSSPVIAAHVSRLDEPVVLPRDGRLAVGPIPERTPGQIAVIVSRPAVVPPPALAPAAPPPPAPQPPPSTTAVVSSQSSSISAVPSIADDRAIESRFGDPREVGSPDQSLEELDILMERIRDSREELGLCAPDRQRLAMLAWICEARSHTDAFPDDVRIRDRVGAISRQLTDIGKTFWPGSVTALQLHIEPRDLPRHLLGGVATTWHRAAELAEQALRNKEHEDERRGFDSYGWADARQTIPRAAHPAEILEELLVGIEQLSGSLETQAAPLDTSIRPDPGSFLRWVRQLRWIRCSEIDPATWARLAGRMRWWAFRRESPLQAAARELEPSFAPTSSWASLLGQDPERRKSEQKIREMLSGPLSVGEDKAALVAWMVAVLPFGDTHHGNIVKLVEPIAERVLQLQPEELPDSDRRLRRRLLRVQEDLKNPPADLKPAPLPDPTNGAEEGEIEVVIPQGDGSTLPEDLLSQVRTVTQGKRSVLVSNRRDPDLTARLLDAFRFATLDLKIAEPRRVQALGEAIQEGHYDLVLGATGFQSQGMDNVLARACRQAGIHYVRVNRGRPVACLRALARDFGRSAST